MIAALLACGVPSHLSRQLALTLSLPPMNHFAFGAFHYTQGWDVAIITGLLGLFWGYLYIRRGSVAASMVSHAGFNGTQVLQELVLKLAR